MGVNTNYEITGKLVIDVSEAKKSLDEAQKLIKEFNKGIKQNTKDTDKNTSSQKNNINTYKDKYSTHEKLINGLNAESRANKELTNEIKKTHDSLVKAGASASEYENGMKRLANNKGLIYRNQAFSNSLNDVSVKTKSLTNQTENLTNAQKFFTDGVESLRKKLHNKELDPANYEKRFKSLKDTVQNDFGVSIKKAGVSLKEGGASIYEFKEHTTDAEKALRNFMKEMRNVNTKVASQKTSLTSADVNAFREAGRVYANALGVKNYSKSELQGSRIRDLTSATLELGEAQGINNKLMGDFSTLSSKTIANIDKHGGSLDSLANKTGNYNKLITQSTRSQRMQNYAMQVSAMRYNALSTSIGFVAGMLGQQLVMGFAEARIQAVQFEQQAQQMLKTSDLTKKEIDDLTQSVENYTKAHRKLNTQGLKYTIAQVTKLNGLSVDEAKKAIPVVADVSNMMQINGRTQEESILAVNDALDGQFRRLQEIGVSGKEMLKAYGWNGNTEDKVSMLDALAKIGEKKGWSDLTADISTLDDAYNVLGNTIDDIVTPSMVQLTPVIVNVINTLSDLLSNLTQLPIPIQGVITVLGILGTAFGKMKLEMFKAKILGSEFMARLTGLDDGMIGITRSIGGVYTTVRDGTLTFEEGSRALMNYHNKSLGISSTFNQMTDDITNVRNSITELGMQYNMGLIDDDTYNNTKKNLELKRAELRSLRDVEQNYARYNLARKVADSETITQLDNLQRYLNLSDAEMIGFVNKANLLDNETGKFKLYNEATDELNTTLRELGVTEEHINNIWTSTKGDAKTKDIRNKTREYLGLTSAVELNTNAVGANEAVQEISNKLRKTGTDEIIANEIATKAVNNVTKKNTSLTGAEAIVKEAETEAIKMNTTQKIINNAENKRGTLSIDKFISGVKKSIKAILEEIKVLAMRAVAWAIANPELALAIALSTALAVIIGGTLLSSQMALTDSLKEFNTVLQESENKISELDKQIEKAQGQTKTDLIERRNQLQEEYNKVNTRSTYLTQQSEIALGKLNKERAKYNKLIAQSNSGTNGNNTQMQSDIDIALNEYDRITNYITRFGLTASERNTKLYNEQLGSLNGLKKGTEEYDDQVKQNTQQMGRYLQTQQDVVDAHQKMLSDDTFTRWGGYLDNWTAHMTMALIEYDAEFSNWVSNNRANVLKFSDDLSKSWDNIGKYINDGIKRFNDYFKDFTLENVGKSINNGLQYIWNNMTIDEMFSNLGQSIQNFPQWLLNQFNNIQLPNLGDIFFQSVSATDGNENTDGMTHEDWINFIGIDPNTLPQEFLTALTNGGNLIWTGVYNFGYGIYTNLKNGVGDLVSIVTNKITNIINAIINAPSKVAQSAWNFGKKIYDKFKDGIGNLSKIVTDEINEIWTEIKNAPSKVAQSAWNFGKSIVDGVNKEVDHHSPGKIARMIRDEVGYVEDFLSQGITTVTPIARAFGSAIVNNTGNLNLTDSAGIINDNNQIMASTNEAQTYTSQQYGTMTNTVTDAFGIMSDTANTDMNSVAMNNATYLAQMNKDTQTNMTQIQATNDGKLKTMQSTTVTATNSMTKAWDIMRNNIVDSASQIRNQSYAKFSSLHRSISGFYKQIQSASFSGGLPAGEPNTNTLSSRTIRKRQSSSNKIGYAGISDDYLKLLDKKGRSEKDIEKFYLKYPQAIPPNSKAIAGNGIAQTHTNKQYNTAKNWGIKDPTMYGVLLNMGYKVSDFDGKSPSISNVTDFERILTQLFTAHPTSYDFYFNSQKSNAEAWSSGSFNCFDGAELVMEIANDLGFGASMAHGTWNGIPHVSAVVGGRLFDTTQWQKRGVWRGASGVNFGGFAGSPDKGKRVKWSTAGKGKFAGGGNTTNNNRKDIVNVYVTGNTFIGEKDYKKQMENIAEDVFYDKMSINPCTGI